jgi:hypothetical protein
VGDAGHQVGAGLLIGGVFLLLGQQMLLHPVEGGAHRGKFVPSPVVDGLGKVPGLHPPGGPGEGVDRLKKLFQLVAGKQGVQQEDHHNGCPAAEEQGEGHGLHPGPGPAQGRRRRAERDGAHQLQLTHPPVQPDHALLGGDVDAHGLEHLLRLPLVVPADGVGGRAVHRQHGHQRHQHRDRITKKEVPPNPHRVSLLTLQMHLYCTMKL